MANIWFSYFDYDGVNLIWKKRPLSHFRAEKYMKGWNSKFSGKVAGTESSGDGYIQVYVDNKPVKAHRIIWEIVNGNIPECMVIDHINHDRKDNRIENLRLTMPIENSRNQTRRKTNTSGFNGVSFNKKCDKYESYMNVDGKKKLIGLFSSAIEASEARIAASQGIFHKNHGEL